MKKKRRHFEENEINDGESPLADTPAGPSGVFINSSRIQLVGLFVRRFSLTPPSCRSFTNSVPLFRPVMYAISFLIHHLSLSPPLFSRELTIEKLYFLLSIYLSQNYMYNLYTLISAYKNNILSALFGSREKRKYKNKNI